MNKDFLYSKPYVTGIIDDTPVDLDIELKRYNAFPFL